MQRLWNGPDRAAHPPRLGPVDQRLAAEQAVSETVFVLLVGGGAAAGPVVFPLDLDPL